MNPVPIDESLVWPDSRRMVIGPANNDPTGPVRPVEAVCDIVALEPDGPAIMRYNMRIGLDPGDLEALERDGHFWVSFIGPQLMPFDVALVPSGVDHASGS